MQNSLMKHIQLRISELWEVCKLFVAWFPAKCFPRKEIWLISERGTDARDNGYCFFSYLKEQHPEVCCKYIISSCSKDKDRLSQYADEVVAYASFEHYVYLWRAKYLISTHIMGFTTNPAFYTRLDNLLHIFRNKKIAFLQHGITKDNLPQLYGDKVRLDLFVCGAKPEYEYILNNFRHPQGVVQCTGLCRYDHLSTFVTKKQILLMPTWRMYIDKQHFTDSEYFVRYQSLLQNPLLHRYLEQYGYRLVFYPHYEIQPFINEFRRLPLPTSVVVADFSYDVQTLRKESAMLITDYSSVYFDMAYMRKPVLFYQFDQEQFFMHHYQRGYFDESSIGTVCQDSGMLLQSLALILERGCTLDNKYKAFIDSFFEKRDANNCSRVYAAIKNM